MDAPSEDLHDELIARVGRGDQGAVEEVLGRLRPLVAAAVRQRLRPDARRWLDPEDLEQVVLAELAGQVSQVPAEGGWSELRRWAWRAVDLRVRDAWRKHRRLVGESAIQAVDPGVGDSASGEVTRDDERRWLEELVSQLPPQYSEIVRLCAFEGLSPEAASQELGISRDVVYKRYEKARRSLQRKWSSRDDG